MPSHTPVLLLKDPSEHPSSDPYAAAFLSASYIPHWVSPLSTVPTHEDALRSIVGNGAKNRWRGVIITSKRAVVAWKAASSGIHKDGTGGKGKEKEVEVDEGWKDVPFFAVGPATAEALSTVPGPSKSLILGAEESGTGSSLARFIISHFASLPSPSTTLLPLLYLTGDKRSPALPEALSSARPPIPFVEQEVYATAPSPTVATEISTLLDSLDEPPRWVILFSPSGAKAVLPVLKERGLLAVAGASSGARKVRIAAIGPTTETWLKDNHGLVPDAVAAKPEPSALVEAIVAADTKS